MLLPRGRSGQGGVGGRRASSPRNLSSSRSAGGSRALTFGPWRAHLALLRAGDPGRTSRKLGAHLLTETMERRPGIGLDSYDRFFPNQDTLPQGGLGNLIALPLQKGPRERGNSVFLDDRARASCRSMGVPLEHPQDRSRPRRAHRRRRGEAGTCCRRAARRPRRKTPPRPGPRLPRDAARSRRSLGRCPIDSSSSSATRSTSPRNRYRPVSTIALSGWPPFRIPSSTRHRRCACRPTTSRASSLVPRTADSTSVCRGAAWTTSESSCRT